ncbi:hypothetical protein, partial [Thermoflexus hugenholtzii]
AGAGFNPTLVRLRPHPGGGVVMIVSRFNPTLVRLRRVVVEAQSNGGSKFQSHAGSIEAERLLPFHEGDGNRFNPTLVRLRPCDFRR